MESQLGMITPFFHKKDGGQIKQAAAPVQINRDKFGFISPAVAGYSWQPALKYQCMDCKEFVEPSDVVDDIKLADKPNAKPAPPVTKTEDGTVTTEPRRTGPIPAPKPIGGPK